MGKPVNNFGRGLVIDESLNGKTVPEALARYTIRSYPFLLNGTPLHITVLRVPMDQLPAVLLALSEALVPEQFYAHFIFGDILYVIFPGVICSIRRGDEGAIQTAETIGIMFRVPMEQMPFARLFTDDHPGGR